MMSGLSVRLVAAVDVDVDVAASAVLVAINKHPNVC